MVYNREALSNAKYDVLDKVLEGVYVECVRLDPDKKKAYVERFRKVIETIIETMKNVDVTFKQIYNRIGYTGSFYDGLRVGEATEFDLNVILKLKLDMMIDKKGCRPGFIGIKVRNTDCQKPIKDWIVNGLLSPVRVKQWLEKVVTKAIEAKSSIINDCRLKFVKSGPAMTLKVFKGTEEISIDLVPVILFPGTVWPPIPRKSKRMLNRSYDEPWFAVPKAEDTWRMSFPVQEQYLIANLQYFRYTVKLLKKVRDDLQMHQVASYYIKTLFLWELEKNQDHTIWSKHRGRLFMHMLMEFREALQNKNLPFYWDANSNLIGSLKVDYINNCYGKLNNFILSINKNIESPHGLDIYIRGKLLKQAPMQAPTKVETKNTQKAMCATQ